MAIGVFGAVSNDQAHKSASRAADEQQRIATERRTFDIERANSLSQQQLYKDFLDAMYVFHKDGELNDSANPWAFANACYRAVHRDFDNARKVQALVFLKEKELIGRRTCNTGCEVKDVEDIIRLKGMNFNNVNLNSDNGGLNPLDLGCILFDGVSMINTTFTEVNLNGVIFNNSRLNGARFSNTSFNCARFENTDMKGADLSQSNISGAVVVNTDLSATKFTADQIEQACLVNVKMPNGTIISSPTRTTTSTTTIRSAPAVTATVTVLTAIKITTTTTTTTGI